MNYFNPSYAFQEYDEVSISALGALQEEMPCKAVVKTENFLRISYRESAKHLSHLDNPEAGRADRIPVMLQHANLLLSTLDLREPETGEHSRRVALIAVAIGKKLSLDQKNILLLQCGALLHDIGKMGVRDDALLKETELTTEDWQEIRAHPEKGAEMLRMSHSLAPLSGIVRSHHERFDGGGYPDGLTGYEIPFMARIVSVADAFDVMTSDRFYKTALTDSEARRQLQNGSGRQFDPNIVEIFLGMHSKS